MAFRILTPLRSPLALGLTVTTAFTAHSLLRPSPSRLLYCDTSPAVPKSSSGWTYTRDARTPVVRDGRLNPYSIRQISTGSILGLIGGVAVSVFSKPLALLIGLAVCAVQFAASRGYNIVPYKRIQKYTSGINVRSALEDNVAFKLSFGAVFALAAFAPM
ncbi:MAG: hypothetical protein M1833_000055 [Piccolia ochrophora]|nr:MAG: hypothetical protein M1833_000055 [Piccolia ochrophora]